VREVVRRQQHLPRDDAVGSQQRVHAFLQTRLPDRGASVALVTTASHAFKSEM